MGQCSLGKLGPDEARIDCAIGFNAPFYTGRDVDRHVQTFHCVPFFVRSLTLCTCAMNACPVASVATVKIELIQKHLCSGQIEITVATEVQDFGQFLPG